MKRRNGVPAFKPTKTTKEETPVTKSPTQKPQQQPLPLASTTIAGKRTIRRCDDVTADFFFFCPCVANIPTAKLTKILNIIRQNNQNQCVNRLTYFSTKITHLFNHGNQDTTDTITTITTLHITFLKLTRPFTKKTPQNQGIE